MTRRWFLRTFGAAVAASALPLRPALGAPGPTIPDSNRQMAARLEAITSQADPLKNPFRNSEAAVLLRQQLAVLSDPKEILPVRMRLAWQLLNCGDAAGALQEHDAVQATMAQLDLPPEQRREVEWMTFRAIAFLRMGENDNCLAGHNSASCLFPIAGDGVHRIQRGSRQAAEALTAILHKYPGDLQARWLLNIAYMTLGEYPRGVPPEHLIDPARFASDYDPGRFPDLAGRVGLDIAGRAGGVVLEDLDGDGLLDVMLSSWGPRDQLRVFQNNGDGTFTERTESAGLTGLTGGLNLIHCDYNNDGHADVLVLRGAWLGREGHYPLSLLRNNGDWTFTDVTAEAGLLRFKPTNSAVWFDYNNDGWLDLYVANETKEGDACPCELFRNNGDGTFTECAAEQGVNFVGFFKAVVSADYNRDGRPDLYLSRLDGPKILLRNDGPAVPGGAADGRWKFTEVADEAGVTDPQTSFTCWFFDYDNDGWDDIYIGGYGISDVGDQAADYLGLPHGAFRAKLYHNNRDGTFTDVTRRMGLDRLLLGMGANFGDLDNDGWLDFYVGTGDPSLSVLIPNRMFRNDAGRRFQDVTTAGGFGQLQKGHGVAFGDINNSGTQDVYAVIGGAVEGDHYRNQLFANPGGNGNRWLKLKLEGVQTNRAAIGALVRVVVSEAGAAREIWRRVGTGGSFGSAPLRLEIGLGQAEAITRVEIQWPVSRTTQVLRGLSPNRAYAVREGDAEARALTLKAFAWPGGLSQAAPPTQTEWNLPSR